MCPDVQIGDEYNEWTVGKCGIPQGYILGSRLFNTFINDMFD